MRECVASPNVSAARRQGADVISFFAHPTVCCGHRLERGIYQKLFKSIQITPINEMMIGII